MKISHLILGTLITLLFQFISVDAQNRIVIEDFDDDDYSGMFQYCQNEEVVWDSRPETECKACIKNGKGSAGMQFSFELQEYCGWGVILSDERGGYDLLMHKVSALSFWVNRETLTDFQIKLKDMDARESVLLASDYLEMDKTGWQHIRIPISDFGEYINYADIENINFGFNDALAVRGENTLWIDELVFETSSAE